MHKATSRLIAQLCDLVELGPAAAATLADNQAILPVHAQTRQVLELWEELLLGELAAEPLLSHAATSADLLEAGLPVLDLLPALSADSPTTSPEIAKLRL